MPTASVPSASLRIHSWLAVYLRSAGMFMAVSNCLGNQGLPVAHERRLHDARRELLVAHCDAHGRSKRTTRRQARARDRRAERGGKGAAGDLAFSKLAVNSLMAAQ